MLSYLKADCLRISKEKTGWVGKDDGFLVLDKNSNGKIDNEVMNKEFNQTLASPISFNSEMNALLFPNKAVVSEVVNGSKTTVTPITIIPLPIMQLRLDTTP